MQLGTTIALGGSSLPPRIKSTAPTAAKPAPADGGIDWVRAAADAEVDAAFARAKAEGKPVFVYWGAKWCPPCNQLQATLFNRQDFIERSRAFVAVYVDGDKPGAQKLGSRFAVRGYPTTVVFGRDGRELTRLPGEVDAQQYNEVLALALGAQRSAKELLAAARAGGQGLGDADWRLLAWHSWETDQQQLVEINASARRILACDDEAVGRSLAELADSGKCGMIRQFQEVVNQRCMGEVYNLAATNAAGESLLVSLTMAPLTSQAGREIGVVLTLREETGAAGGQAG